MKKILLIATGGTICSRERGEGLEPLIAPEEMISYIGGFKDCSVDCVELLRLDSTNIIPSHWLKIAECIRKNYVSYDGFLITHGTDTLSYTACALSYLLQNSEKPIVITGSQKPVDALGTDAVKNLRDSLSFACSDRCGVSVVFGGYAIDGVCAKKMRTKGFKAFESVNCSYLAEIDGGKITITGERKIKGKVKFYNSLNNNVAIINLTPGMNTEIIEKAGECCDGIIIAGYGSGGIPDNCIDAVQRLTSMGKTVVISTQCIFDGTSLDKYKVGRNAKKFSVLEAGEMTAEHTLIKLMWILAQTGNPERIKELWSKHIN